MEISPDGSKVAYETTPKAGGSEIVIVDTKDWLEAKALAAPSKEAPPEESPTEAETDGEAEG